MKAYLIPFIIVVISASSFPVGADIAVNVGDRVKLKSTHHAGVPVHKLPQGTPDFRRVPDGTEATVVELANNGRWLRLEFANQPPGWITKRYVAEILPPMPAEGGPSPGRPMPTTEDRNAVWRDRDSCLQIVRQGKRMAKNDAKTLRTATWNIRWFPRGCSSSEVCDENATDIDWLACAITWMNLDILAVQEILDTPPARAQLATLTDRLNALTGGEWQNDLHSCGSAGSQHVGFLWNGKNVSLENFADASQLNGASTNGQACDSNLRPGRYAHVTSKTPRGADFHLISVHFDSGRSNRDYQHRRIAASRIPFIEIEGAPILNSDLDVVVLGDFNTMGRGEPPEINASEEIATFDSELAPGFRRLDEAPFCTEYFEGHPGALDHIVVFTGMREVSGSAAVSGYCAVLECGALSGNGPAAYEQLSDHCPVVFDIRNEDMD